jgi:ketosteroid isomerase-like protein
MTRTKNRTKQVVSLIILLVITACATVAQTAPDSAELTRLLNEFLAGASRNDVAVHERFWADDLIYTRSAGRRVNKAEILRDVRSAPPPKPGDPKSIYTAEDVRIQQYGNTAIVAFRLVATTETEGTKQVASLLNSGTFVKRNGKWQVVNWQSTRMPRTEADSKREVTETDAAFHQAMAAADVSKVTALTDETFIWTHAGEQMNRKQMLDDLSSGRLKYAKPQAAKLNVSAYGDAAVVRGAWLTPQAAHYTLMFINSGGAWKAVSMHTSQ